MRPTGDRLYIKPLPGDDLTESGLIIPEAAKGKPTRAEVLAIGDLVDPEKHTFPGDIILFPENAGMDFTLDNVDMKAIRWNDVQGTGFEQVPSAQEIIRKNRLEETDFITVKILQHLNAGTVKEKFLIQIHGKKFYLQGNYLESVKE